MAAALPIVMIGMTLLGSMMSAQGAKQSGRAQQQAAEYNARIAENNATVSRQQAAADATLMAREARQRQGMIAAGYASAGVTPEGSPIDVLAQSAAEAQLDIETTKYKGEVRAIGYQNEANLQRFAGRNAMAQAKARSSEILIGGVTKGLSMFPTGFGGGAGSSITIGGGTAP